MDGRPRRFCELAPVSLVSIASSLVDGAGVDGVGCGVVTVAVGAADTGVAGAPLPRTFLRPFGVAAAAADAVGVETADGVDAVKAEAPRLRFVPERDGVVSASWILPTASSLTGG